MPLQRTIDTLLQRAADAGDIPGVIAAVGDRSGTLYEGAFGKRTLDHEQAMTADTVCWIASMTKAITGAAAMQLVEQGRLALDDPLSDVLPALGKREVLLGFDAQGQPQTRPAKRPITLRHLLTHTAGFGYDMWNADIGRFQRGRDLPLMSTGRNGALETPLQFEPGERWCYGISIDWVGKAVEAVSGQTLGQYMKANIFEPLGMEDTGFKLGASQLARRATVHARKAEGLVTTPMLVEQNPEFEGGGGGLYSTASDYLRFTRMILNGGMLDGARVLKPETVALMSQNAMGETRCTPMIAANKGASNDVMFVDGMQWGLTFMINPTRMATGRSAGSLAWAGLGNCYYWIDPAKNITGVFLTQVLPFADVKALPLFQAMETAVYA